MAQRCSMTNWSIWRDTKPRVIKILTLVKKSRVHTVKTQRKSSRIVFIHRKDNIMQNLSSLKNMVTMIIPQAHRCKTWRRNFVWYDIKRVTQSTRKYTAWNSGATRSVFPRGDTFPSDMKLISGHDSSPKDLFHRSLVWEFSLFCCRCSGRGLLPLLHGLWLFLWRVIHSAKNKGQLKMISLGRTQLRGAAGREQISLQIEKTCFRHWQHPPTKCSLTGNRNVAWRCRLINLWSSGNEMDSCQWGKCWTFIWLTLGFFQVILSASQVEGQNQVWKRFHQEVLKICWSLQWELYPALHEPTDHNCGMT